MNNKTVYETHDFEQWAYRKGLLLEEAYFLSKYLPNKDNNTLEAGTGGGRISFALEEQGYSKLSAFDFVEPFIEAAKIKDPDSRINFFVADATDLNLLQDNTFDQIIYLQQIISIIPSPLIETALVEAKRVLKRDGIALFSFLNWEGRSYNTPLSIFTNFFRRLRKESVSKQDLPWLKLGGKFNWKFLSSKQSTTYWFTKEEIMTMLERLGFTILEVKTASELTGVSSKGMLYIACTKREPDAS